ncbi:MAG: Gfo/Idh/MocA family oxidoreductase [Bacteroidales bacterium]|jgi:predicted dehydrogenase|nr:Gfo/Idh/MocA family oxidoreductase [Bacteroidales bacterium]
MIKIGVIGTGHLGKIHLNCLKNIPSVELIGFYDAQLSVANEVEQCYKIKKYLTELSLIEICDAVDIVAPTTMHYDLAMEAMRKGKHVFLEKPITATLKQSEEIVSYAKKHNIKVQVGHVERFNDAYLGAKPYLDNPLFIESHRLAEFNPRGTDVSVVLDLMIHDIDIVLSMIKSPIKHISANGVPVISETPDIANARIEFENGATANLTASRISMKKMRKMRVFQPNAYITIDFLEKQANIMRLRDYVPEDDNELLSLILDLGNNRGKKRIFIESPSNEKVNAIEMELSLFADSIINDRPNVVSAEDGHKALEVAYQIMDKFIYDIK